MELEKNVEKYGLLFISAVTVLLLTIIELILEPWNIVNMAFVYLLVLKGLPVLWREASETIFNEKAERMWFRCMVIIVFFMILIVNYIILILNLFYIMLIIVI